MGGAHDTLFVVRVWGAPQVLAHSQLGAGPAGLGGEASLSLSRSESSRHGAMLPPGRRVRSCPPCAQAEAHSPAQPSDPGGDVPHVKPAHEHEPQHEHSGNGLHGEGQQGQRAQQDSRGSRVSGQRARSTTEAHELASTSPAAVMRRVCRTEQGAPPC